MTIVRIDLDALQAAGALSAHEVIRLRRLALPEQRGSLAINCLMIFGALAVAAGAVALIPTPATGLVLALAALGGAQALRQREGGEAWRVLSAALAIMGASGVAGWIAAETWDSEHIFWPPIAITAVIATCAVWFRSPFLAAGGVLSAGSILGTGTAYWHASYGLYVREATLTIALFAALALALYKARDRLSHAWSALCTAAARTAFFLMNFGFWVGSLWGDLVGEHWVAGDRWRAPSEWRNAALEVPEAVFSLGWVGVLAAVIWKTRRGGFLSMTAVVFLAIHAYTQYFETFGAHPETLLVGGIAAVALAVAAARWANRRTVV